MVIFALIYLFIFGFVTIVEVTEDDTLSGYLETITRMTAIFTALALMFYPLIVLLSLLTIVLNK